MFLMLWFFQSIFVWLVGGYFWVRVFKEDLKIKNIILLFFVGAIPVIGLLALVMVVGLTLAILWDDKGSFFHKTIIKAKK